MAIKKEHTFKGFTGEYRRIIKIDNVDFNRNTARVTIGLYKDKATRDADEFSHIMFQVANLKDFDNMYGDLAQQSYEKLMSEAPNAFDKRIDFTIDSEEV